MIRSSHVSTFGTCILVALIALQLNTSEILLLLRHPVSHEGAWVAGCLPASVRGQTSRRLLVYRLILHHVSILLGDRDAPSILDTLNGVCIIALTCLVHDGLIGLVRDEATRT